MVSETIRIGFDAKGIGAGQGERVSCELHWVAASETILSECAVVDFECDVAMRQVLVSERLDAILEGLPSGEIQSAALDIDSNWIPPKPIRWPLGIALDHRGMATRLRGVCDRDGGASKFGCHDS